MATGVSERIADHATGADPVVERMVHVTVHPEIGLLDQVIEMRGVRRRITVALVFGG